MPLRCSPVALSPCCRCRLQAFLAAISFLESCRRQAAGTTAAGSSGGMAPDSAASYLLLLENALLAAAPSELHAAALGAMLAVAAAQQGAFAAAFAADAPRQQLLLHLLGHVDAGARQAAAQLLGMLVPHLGAPPKGPAAQQPGQEVPSQGGSPTARVSALCDALLSTLRVGGADGAKHAKQEQVEGAAAGAGYVAAHLLKGKSESLLPSLLQPTAYQLPRCWLLAGMFVVSLTAPAVVPPCLQAHLQCRRNCCCRCCSSCANCCRPPRPPLPRRPPPPLAPAACAQALPWRWPSPACRWRQLAPARAQSQPGCCCLPCHTPLGRLPRLPHC